MKNLVRNSVSIFAMLILTVATTFANDPYLKLEKVADKTIGFKINKLSAPFNVSFKNSEGELIYEETYSSDKASSRKYDLREIVSGKYYFEIETEFTIEKYLVVVNSKTAEIVEKSVTILNKPIVIKVNDKVLVTKLNLSKDDLKISIYDDNGNGLYTETITADKSEFSIGKKFDFSKVDKGEYTFYLTTDKKTYKKTVSL